MHLLKVEHFLVLLFLQFVGLIVLIHGQRHKAVTFYENYNTQGRRIHFNNVRNCTTLPSPWNQIVSSLDTHDNCFLFYDKANCAGKFLQAKVLDEDSSIIPKLKKFGFNNKIKSVKPCNVGHIKPGRRYKIQNVANRKFLTAQNPRKLESGWTKLKTKKWKKEVSQQWKVEQNLSDKYFLIPRTLPTYAFHSSKRNGTNTKVSSELTIKDPAVIRDREPWDLIWLFEDTSLIRNVHSKKCLEMNIIPNGIGSGNITQARCNNHSKYQQWIFHEL